MGTGDMGAWGHGGLGEWGHGGLGTWGNGDVAWGHRCVWGHGGAWAVGTRVYWDTWGEYGAKGRGSFGGLRGGGLSPWRGALTVAGGAQAWRVQCSRAPQRSAVSQLWHQAEGGTPQCPPGTPSPAATVSTRHPHPGLAGDPGVWEPPPQCSPPAVPSQPKTPRGDPGVWDIPPPSPQAPPLKRGPRCLGPSLSVWVSPPPSTIGPMGSVHPAWGGTSQFGGAPSF